jgi:hypothetical protein
MLDYYEISNIDMNIKDFARGYTCKEHVWCKDNEKLW